VARDINISKKFQIEIERILKVLTRKERTPVMNEILMDLIFVVIAAAFVLGAAWHDYE